MNTYTQTVRSEASTYFTRIRQVLVATTLSVVALTGPISNAAAANSVKLLTANFQPRQVVQVEAGDFHFTPGQVAPIHTHTAPAVGYVLKGEILYQVEGEKPQILREGDAFYEPAGPRILRFDNASATAEAIFIDFNLEQAGEPFIVFENPPTEAIDRRTLPTVDIDDQLIDRVEVFSRELERSQTLKLETDKPTLGLVAEGIVELQIQGTTTQRIVAGASFSVPAGGAQATVTNESSELPAKIITFALR